MELARARGNVAASDCKPTSLFWFNKGIYTLILFIAVNFSEYDRGEPSGQVNLIGRIKYVRIVRLKSSELMIYIPT